ISFFINKIVWIYLFFVPTIILGNQVPTDTFIYYHLDVTINKEKVKTKVPCIHILKENEFYPVIGQAIKHGDTFLYQQNFANVYKCGSINNMYVATSFEDFEFFKGDYSKLNQFKLSHRWSWYEMPVN